MHIMCLTYQEEDVVDIRESSARKHGGVTKKEYGANVYGYDPLRD